jgi:hypothetical protein
MTGIASCPIIRGRIVAMPRSKTGRTAVFGFVMLSFGFAWAGVRDYLIKRAFPPGWIVDVAPYQPAFTFIWVGFLVLLTTAIIACAKYRRNVKYPPNRG